MTEIFIVLRTKRLWQNHFTAVYCGQETDRRRQHPRVWRNPGLQTVRSSRATGGLHATGAGTVWRVHHQGNFTVLREVRHEDRGVLVFILQLQDLQYVLGENQTAK